LPAVCMAQDAVLCLRLDPGYTAGYFRLGYSLYALGRFREAVDAFMLALRVVPGNLHFRRGLEVSQRELQKQVAAGGGGDDDN
jgi:hypothetical protein